MPCRCESKPEGFLSALQALVQKARAKYSAADDPGGNRDSLPSRVDVASSGAAPKEPLYGPSAAGSGSPKGGLVQTHRTNIGGGGGGGVVGLDTRATPAVVGLGKAVSNAPLFGAFTDGTAGATGGTGPTAPFFGNPSVNGNPPMVNNALGQGNPSGPSAPVAALENFQPLLSTNQSMLEQEVVAIVKQYNPEKADKVPGFIKK
jgi:hypothetical protein